MLFYIIKCSSSWENSNSKQKSRKKGILSLTLEGHEENQQ